MPRLDDPVVMALDTETTGVDFHHGAQPFFVTVCYSDGRQRWWEWEVDPETRKITVPPDEPKQIQQVVEEADLLILQNAKFDAAALTVAQPRILSIDWPWHKTQDTLLDAHLLASNHPHNLTSLCITYLGRDISPYEERLKKACMEARRIARSKFPGWRIAKEGLEDMPSAKGGKAKKEREVEDESPWKFDSWLPRTIAKHLEYPELDPDCPHDDWEGWNCVSCGGHRWWIILSEYSNVDSASTVALGVVLRKELRSRK